MKEITFIEWILDRGGDPTRDYDRDGRQAGLIWVIKDPSGTCRLQLEFIDWDGEPHVRAKIMPNVLIGMDWHGKFTKDDILSEFWNKSKLMVEYANAFLKMCPCPAKKEWESKDGNSAWY